MMSPLSIDAAPSTIATDSLSSPVHSPPNAGAHSFDAHLQRAHSKPSSDSKDHNTKASGDSPSTAPNPEPSEPTDAASSGDDKAKTLDASKDDGSQDNSDTAQAVDPAMAAAIAGQIEQPTKSLDPQPMIVLPEDGSQVVATETTDGSGSDQSALSDVTQSYSTRLQGSDLPAPAASVVTEEATVTVATDGTQLADATPTTAGNSQPSATIEKVAPTNAVQTSINATNSGQSQEANARQGKGGSSSTAAADTQATETASSSAGRKKGTSDGRSQAAPEVSQADATMGVGTAPPSPILDADGESETKNDQSSVDGVTSTTKQSPDALPAGTVENSKTASEAASDAARGADSVPGGSRSQEADRTRFVQRVAKAFEAVGDRNGSVRVRLSPPELGSMRLDITYRNGTVSAHVEAQTTAARDVLLENLPALRDRLSQQDIKIERFDVDLADPSLNGSSQQQADNQGDSQSPRSSSRQSDSGTVEAISSSDMGGIIGEGSGLNVLI